ncbi:unnamed protein product [Closterium sp. NIES-65]|nr:unnamed protein product [Closterium sp. NIES-65]
MMWAVANNATASSLSPQQVCDCATKQCCQGGWPDWAFSYVLNNGGITSNKNYPYQAYDSATCLLDTSMPSVAQITGWELVPAFNAMALMKAVSMQPVVAFISASTSDFAMYKSRDVLRIYDGVCLTEVNHAVVVVGFNYTGPDLKGSYWIIKNSWYTTWGDRGYMYLAMTPDVRGKCGILSIPAMYPVYYPSGPQPARFCSDTRGKWNINKVDDLSSSLFSSALSTDSSSTTTLTTSTTITTSSTIVMLASVTGTSTDASSLLINSTTKSASQITACAGIINPCGGGSCYMLGGIARCDCGLLSNMVEVMGVPTSKCAPQNPCTNSPVNPCRGGTCMDVGDGTYTCTCASGYAIGTAVDGSTTCLPAAGLTKSYVTLPGDNCTLVATEFGISTTTLSALNPFINCSVTEYLPPGVGLTVSRALTATSTFCTSTYTVQPSDTCNSIAHLFFGGSLTALDNLNPGLTCNRLFKSQQICLKADSSSSTTSGPQCGQSVAVVMGDTCASVSIKYMISSSTFSSLNPGLNCDSPLLVGSYVCVAPKSSDTTINCTGWYRVMQGDTCPSIWNGANLTMSMFQAINPGIQCQAPYLVVGQQVCIDSPVLTTMQRAPNTSYSIYTVRPNDTLSTISSLFLPRCTPTSVSPESIAAQNYISDLSAPLAPGTKLIIPCIGRIGMVDCGCAASIPVCGSDFVSYPSYCDALCNFALPALPDSFCTGACGPACQGRMGLAPVPNSGCTNAICPYPSWAPAESIDCAKVVDTSSGPCCSYRENTCKQQCTLTAAGLGGTVAQRNSSYNDCYSQCMCCQATGCGGATCKAPSACWNARPRKCVFVNYSYVWNCTWFPAGNPLP